MAKYQFRQYIVIEAKDVVESKEKNKKKKKKTD